MMRSDSKEAGTFVAVTKPPPQGEPDRPEQGERTVAAPGDDRKDGEARQAQYRDGGATRAEVGDQVRR